MKSIVTLVVFAFAVSLSTAAPAHIVEYAASLAGPNEDPANNSPGTGTARLIIDLDLLTMNVDADFSGLTGLVSIAHIHCCTAVAGAGNVGVATALPTFPGFPAGVNAGSYNMDFDLTDAGTYNAGFITASGGSVGDAMNALLVGLQDGKAYFNIHTSLFPGGEIRGFLQVVPIPAALWLLGSGLAGLGWVTRKRAA